MVEIFDSIKKYNFWGGNVVETGFERTAYTNKIIQYIARTAQFAECRDAT
jgi:uncharacterized protein